jgi:hypothetical protein
MSFGGAGGISTFFLFLMLIWILILFSLAKLSLSRSLAICFSPNYLYEREGVY